MQPMLQWLGSSPADALSDLPVELRQARIHARKYDDPTCRSSDRVSSVRRDHECRVCASNEAESAVGLGTFMVCFFHTGRRRCPHRDRVAHRPWALVHVCGGFGRNLGKNGAVRCELGSLPCVFWSSSYSNRPIHHLRGVSRNLGGRGRAHPTAYSTP